MSQSKNVAISVKNVAKDFVLPHEQNTSIKSSVVNIFKKKDRTVDIQHALKGVSFDIKDGEFFGILGRNGSGKSTLLKILAEIYKPTKGTVKHTGKLVPFIELGVGFNPELTGRENVYLNGALLGFSRKEIDVRYDDIVKFAELEEFMDQKLKNYSSGMQVRLAFSVATRAEADILLVDEVLAVGDADFQRKCYDFFKSLKKAKKTVVFVTHDMSAVREYCDTAVLIEEGVITHRGKASKVADEYLKLFNRPADYEQTKDTQSNNNRWGNKKAIISDIKASALNNGKSIEINATILANEYTEGLVAGIRIKDNSGQIITGFNSEKAGNITVAESREINVHFSMPNIFSDGIFTVDSTLRLSDGVTICDNWDDATRFNITRNIKTPYVIIPEVSVKLEEVD